ncbi:MAG: hypothetical protein ABI690_02075 [Chloroflexota bacterium]
MINISLPDDIAKRLEEIAQREKRPVDEVVASMAQHYTPKSHSREESDVAWESILGIYHDDVTDLSMTVRETMHKYFYDKYGDSTEVLNRLEDVARRENRSLIDLLSTWIDDHISRDIQKKAAPNWDNIVGIGDENVTDMSTTVRETLYKKPES